VRLPVYFFPEVGYAQAAFCHKLEVP
jgi:hypothetical protein